MAEAILDTSSDVPANGQPRPNRSVWLYDDSGKVTRKTYAEVREEALGWAGWFRQVGVRRGQVVFIGLPTGWDYLGALFGSIVSGIVPCTVPLGAEPEVSNGALHNTTGSYKAISPCLYVTTAEVLSTLRNCGSIPTAILAHVPPDQRNRAISREELPTISPSDPHHLQLTSGSTEAPKAAVLTHASVLANINAVAEAVTADSEADSGCCWLPMFHDMGLMQLLMMTRFHAKCVLQSPLSFLRNPIRWLERIHEHRISMAAAPAFAYSYCVRRYRADIASRLDLSCWRIAGVGAERVEHRVLRQFHERYREHGFSAARFLNCYGMAEAGFAVAVPRRAYSLTDPHTIPSVGRPVAGMDISVRDPAGIELPDGEKGELYMRGSSMMQGYYGNAAPPQNAEGGGSEWFRTGDIGYYKDGELYVAGRAKDLVILRGRNYFPHEFEECVTGIPEVEMHRAAAFGLYREDFGTEGLVLVIELHLRRNLAELRSRLQRMLRERFGFGAQDILFVPYGAIPRTTSHKVQRSRCRELYLQGKLLAADREVPGDSENLSASMSAPLDSPSDQQRSEHTSDLDLGTQRAQQ